MNVTYSEKAKESNEAYSYLRQATGYLEEVLGQSSGLVNAEWDRTDDKGRSYYTLRISDWTGGASTMFDIHELKSAERMRVRLYRLWGELIQVRVNKAFQKVNEDG